MNNPMLYIDPSGYRHKTAQEREHDEIWMDYMPEVYWEGRRSFGGGGGLFNDYMQARFNGYAGDMSNFQQQYSNPKAWFNGKLKLTWTTQKQSTAELVVTKIGTKEYSFSDCIIYPVITHSLTVDLNSLGMNGRKIQNYLYGSPEGDIVTTVGANASIYKKLPAIKNSVISTHYGEVNYKGGKYMGAIGNAGNVISSLGAINNLMNDPSSVEYYTDAFFTGIGFIPVYGDFNAMLYMGAKDQINIRKENIINNRPTEYGTYVPATGDIWIYSY